MTEGTLQTEFNPNDRELCPDGACIGVIGADGRCAECGKGSAMKTPSAGRKAPQDIGPAPKPTAALGADAVPATTDGPREVEGDDFDPARRELCADGACIGIIGSDGQCAECGKSAPGGSRSTVPTTSTPSRDADGEAAPDLDNEADSATTGQDDNPDGASDDQSAEDERDLCSDGACIGLIGSNGRCKVCGTRAD